MALAGAITDAASSMAWYWYVITWLHCLHRTQGGWCKQDMGSTLATHDGMLTAALCHSGGYHSAPGPPCTGGR